MSSSFARDASKLHAYNNENCGISVGPLDVVDSNGPLGWVKDMVKGYKINLYLFLPIILKSVHRKLN